MLLRVILAAFAVCPVIGADLVTDPALRLELVRAAYPKSQVEPERSKPLDWRSSRWAGSKSAPDALAGEPEFKVVDREELRNGYWRRVRFRAYELKPVDGKRRFVALAHGHIDGDATPLGSICCEWFSTLFLISGNGRRWESQGADAGVYRGNGVRRFEVADIDGDGSEEAIVESEQSGAAGEEGISNWFMMLIFGLDGSAPGPITMAATSARGFTGVGFDVGLDVAATRRYRGTKYCFAGLGYRETHEQHVAACVDRGFQALPPWWPK